MRARFALKMLVSAAALAAAVPAAAAPIIDQSPNALAPFAGNFNVVNISSNQSFYVQVVLTQTVQVNGFSIFSDLFTRFDLGYGLGTSVVFRLRNDAAGLPDDTSVLRSIATTLSAIDNVGSSDPFLNRLHADFTPFTLGPGTYWASLSGESQDIGWNFDAARAGSNTPACQFFGDEFAQCFESTTAFPFTLDGETTSAVPEPATWAMLILGIGAVGGALRRRTRVALPA